MPAPFTLAASLHRHVCRKAAKPLPQRRLWLVVQGYNVSGEAEKAVRRKAGEIGPGAILVARPRLDQSYEPRILKRSMVQKP